MQKIRIVTDSSSDIPADIVADLGIEVIPLYVGYGSEMYKDNIQITHEEVFDALLAGMKVNTASPSPGDFYDVFNKILDENDNSTIICITLSSRLSGSYNSANAARKLLPAEDIRIIDSKTSTLALGLIVVQAAQQARKGIKVEEVLKLVSDLINLTRFIAYLGSFEYVLKGGRASFFANILNKALFLTPVLTIGRSGKVHLQKFCRNKQNALQFIYSRAIAVALEHKDVFIGLFYGKDPAPLEEARNALLASDNISIKKIVENKITTVISAHTGPEIWGIAVIPVLT